MALKKGIPGKGVQGRADSFSYTPVASGLKASFTGWLAGDPYWALAHEHTKATPGTKPCLDWMCDGAVCCRRCRPHTKPVWIGWVPLYREADGKPIMLIVHEGTMDLLAGLTYPTHVLCGRVDENSSVFVKKSDSAVSFTTANEQRKRPVDITGDLLTMWGLPELERWLMEQKHAPAVEHKKSNGEPFDQMHAAAARRFAPPATVETPGDDVYAEAQRRMMERAGAPAPSTNGKHKPKG